MGGGCGFSADQWFGPRGMRCIKSGSREDLKPEREKQTVSDSSVLRRTRVAGFVLATSVSNLPLGHWQR